MQSFRAESIFLSSGSVSLSIKNDLILSGMIEKIYPALIEPLMDLFFMINNSPQGIGVPVKYHQLQ